MRHAGTQSFHCIDRAVITIYLCPPSNTGLYMMTQCVIGYDILIAPVLDLHRDRVRARADERHLAPQHVEKLGQFVEARPPQEMSDPGDSRIVLARLAHAREIGVLVIHRAELEHPNHPVAKAEPRLAEQDRTLAVQL